VSKKASAWLTPREAAIMIGWRDDNATERLTRTIRRAEKSSGVKVLQIIPTPERTRLMLTMAGLRKALPHLFVSSAEHLPAAINERFDEVVGRIGDVAARGGVHGSLLRRYAHRISALEAIVRKLQAQELRLVKGGLK
jgi:hypothetical protein